MKLACSAALVLVAALPAAPGSAAATHRKAATAHATEAAPAVEAKSVLPFLYDDYPKAVALARANKVPLFIEAWAPW
jgi:hypothetical protein